jgi:transposase
MLRAGLDLSRERLDVCLLSGHGELVEEFAVASDDDGVGGLARRVLERGEPVRGVIDSMTGARFVHDTLEQQGWEVEIADAQKVKGLAPLACKTDKIDSMVLAVLSQRDLVRRSGCPILIFARSASSLAFACIWSSTARCSSTGSTRR